jgi:hypothetical protein
MAQSSASDGDSSVQYVLKILSRMCLPVSLLGRMNKALVSLEPTLDILFVQIVIESESLLCGPNYVPFQL